MKQILCVLILCLAIIVSGCDKNKPILVLNSKPITAKTVNYPVQNFEVGQRINYALIMPKGFNDSAIRLQIIKKEEKAAYWGYKISQTYDRNVDTSKKFYIDYFTINKSGYYIIRAFEINNLDKQLAIMDFWVK